MKISLLTCLCALGVSLAAWGQTPGASPDSPALASTPFSSATPALGATTNPAAATVSPVTSVPPNFVIGRSHSVSPTVSPNTASDSDDETIDSAIEKKIKKHLNLTFDGDHHSGSDDVPWIAIPIVLIVFLAIFGTPVMIVGLIMYFSFSKSRALHRTVRMMVEKGQPVPEALLNPPPIIRQRSDLRRGIVLTMVGFGLMVFFGAVNNWEEGIWSLGLIPFLIGVGYLLVWRLDVRRAEELPPKEGTSTKV
jgi:hypothetical protein